MGRVVVLVLFGDFGVFVMVVVVLEVLYGVGELVWDVVELWIFFGVLVVLVIVVRVGVFLGYDFCVLLLFDNFKFWEVIEWCLDLVGVVDLVMVFYNLILWVWFW